MARTSEDLDRKLAALEESIQILLGDS